MDEPINPQYQEYVNDTRDQILNDLGFNNDLDLILYIQEQPEPLVKLIEMLNENKWCFYHSIDEEVIPVRSWKSILEYLPQAHQKVLVRNKLEEIQIGYLHTPFTDKEWLIENDKNVYGLTHITHWQELPHNSEKSVDQKEQPEKVRGAFGTL
tara:strand:- start:112 stop:570 length:459 start_codon:yes stop_codon:yes gene_type:complete